MGVIWSGCGDQANTHRCRGWARRSSVSPRRKEEVKENKADDHSEKETNKGDPRGRSRSLHPRAVGEDRARLRRHRGRDSPLRFTA